MLEHENDERMAKKSAAIGEGNDCRTISFTVLHWGKFSTLWQSMPGIRFHSSSMVQSNQLLMLACISTFLLQLAVIYRHSCSAHLKHRH
jgi:hypothetical protein